MNYEGTSKGEAEHFLSRVIKEDMESGCIRDPLQRDFRLNPTVLAYWERVRDPCESHDGPSVRGNL